MNNYDAINIDEEISLIKALKQNWDGYGAEPFNSEFCDEVSKVIKKLPKLPGAIFPTAADSIQVEYHSYQLRLGYTYIEISFHLDGHVSALVSQGNSIKTYSPIQMYQVHELISKVVK